MEFHIIEDRRAVMSPYGRGNGKIGPNVYTYSKLPGRENTCPGSTDECEAVCYAKRLAITPIVRELYQSNTQRGDVVPPIPADAELVRIHISGDFDTIAYIQAWRYTAINNPQITFWGYTRSWRDPELLIALEALRLLENVALFASVDKTSELPPDDWQRAYIEGDSRIRPTRETNGKPTNWISEDGRRAITCPEQLGIRSSCEDCGFCFRQRKTDLVFLKH